MKTAFTIFITVAVIITSVYVLNQNNYYTVNARVTHVDRDAVTVMTQNGNYWDFVGTGFYVGEDVVVKFFTNYTDSEHLDDEIVDVVKEGET